MNLTLPSIAPMSQDDIHEVASKTTPEGVQVPNTMPGLITWAIGKFGGSAVIAIGLSYAIIRIYTDMQVTQAQVMEMVRASTSTQAEVAQAIREMGKQIEANTRAAERGQ